MGRILGNGLTRAAESEQREIELSFWAELLPDGDKIIPTMMEYFLPPTTRRDDRGLKCHQRCHSEGV